MTMLCFGLSSMISVVTSWEWWSWSLPVGILSSFGILHSGLFGTFTPLKLTSVRINEDDQMVALISTVLVLVVQYGRKVPAVKWGARKMTNLMVRDMYDTQQ